MLDVIARTNEFITRKEVFDIRTVRYIFESYGVDYFPEIPMKYQIRMVKNLHTLLKYKSTPKCMVDICSLFGFDNITIFKYYLLRDRNYSKSKDEYSFEVDEEGNDNYEDNFELKFVKIPIDEPMAEYIRDPKYYYDYDEIVEGDPTWNGGLEHDVVKRQHLEADYNYTRTKYLSIDSMYDIAKISIQQCYFFNMLYDNIKLETDINLSIPYISGTKKFNIADIFIFLTCITYQYHNMKDLIFDTQGKILSVYGFNFKADMAVIAADLANMGYTLEAKEMFEKFNIPTTSIPNMTQLMNIFINNLEVRDVLVMGMKNADNLRVYNTYKYLYDSLMVMELTMDFFKDPEIGDFRRDEEGDATYTMYLQWKDPVLYYKLKDIEALDDDTEAKTQTIANLIDNIVYILENYIDTEEFAGLFYHLPVVSVEAVKGYIKSVIDFYKSYKVHFLGINTIYYFDDKYDGWIKIIDWCLLNRWFEKDEIIPIIERIYQMNVTMTIPEKIAILEKVFLDISTWAYKDYMEFARLLDRYILLGTIKTENVVYLKDTLHSLKVSNKLEDGIIFGDYLNLVKAAYAITDEYNPKDALAITRVFVPMKNKDFDYVVIPAGTGTLRVDFDGITSTSYGSFIPLESMLDIYSSSEVKCYDGYAVITLTDPTYEIIGTLKISMPGNYDPLNI